MADGFNIHALLKSNRSSDFACAVSFSCLGAVLGGYSHEFVGQVNGVLEPACNSLFGSRLTAYMFIVAEKETVMMLLGIPESLRALTVLPQRASNIDLHWEIVQARLMSQECNSAIGMEGGVHLVSKARHGVNGRCEKGRCEA